MGREVPRAGSSREGGSMQSARRHLLLGAAVVILAMVIVGCEWVPTSAWSSDGDLGRLRIRLPEPEGSRSIVPGLDMTINGYEASLAGPGTPQSQPLASDATTTTFTDLVPGDWTVTVDALNADDPPTVIARDEQIVTIEAGMTTIANMSLSPLAGNGTLELTVEWPAGLLAAPDVEAILTPESGGATDISTGFDPGTSGTFDFLSYSATEWAAGYYTLSLALTDGAVTVWGPEIVAVRIISGEASIGAYTLAEADLNLLEQVGSVQVNIGVDLQNPYTVALSGQQDTIAPDGTMTVTAALTPAASATVDYDWYLNGTLQADDGDSIVLDSADNLVDGMAYRLSLIVRDGPTISSESTSFRVDSAAP